jgi:hypothetical protein
MKRIYCGLVLILLFMPLASAEDAWTFCVRKDIQPISTFTVDQFTITLRDKMTDIDDNGNEYTECILIEITCPEGLPADEESLNLMNKGETLIFANGEYYICYVGDKNKKQMLSVFKHNKPALGVAMEQQKTFYTEDYKYKLLIYNSGITAWDLRVDVILPEGYTLNNDTLVKNLEFPNSNYFNSTFRLERTDDELGSSIMIIALEYTYADQKDTTKLLRYFDITTGEEIKYDIVVGVENPETLESATVTNVEKEATVPENVTNMTIKTVKMITIPQQAITTPTIEISTEIDKDMLANITNSTGNITTGSEVKFSPDTYEQNSKKDVTTKTQEEETTRFKVKKYVIYAIVGLFVIGMFLKRLIFN